MNGEAFSIPALAGVNETLFHPLVAKHLETNKEDGILHDPKSAEIIERLGYDITRAKMPSLERIGICLRSVLLDDITRGFVEKNPSGVVVNLGCGLDTRFGRLDNGRVLWFDLDLPDTIALRRLFFRETARNRFVAKSALDFSWAEEIPRSSPALFIAEGLSYYFTEDENKALFSTIQEHFPNAEYVFDTVHPLFSKLYKKKQSDEQLTKRVIALVKWGVKSGRELESWFEGVQLVEEWSVINRGRDRLPCFFRMLFSVFPILTGFTKIIHVRFT